MRQQGAAAEAGEPSVDAHGAQGLVAWPWLSAQLMGEPSGA